MSGMSGRRNGQGMGQGRGQASGNSSGRTGSGGGRNGGGGFGSGGVCICAHCGAKVPHSRGTKCTDLRCPECGKPMVREELLNSKRQ